MQLSDCTTVLLEQVNLVVKLVHMAGEISVQL
jgi:hypothetical protein